jgi:hypothetical protein
MRTTILLSTLLFVLVTFLYNKEKFQEATSTTAYVDEAEADAEEEAEVDNNNELSAILNNIATDVLEEEAAEEEAAEEEEDDGYVDTEPEIMPLLNYKKTYEPFTEDKYINVDFNETEDKLVNRNHHILPPMPEHTIQQFPCRTVQHVWDYTGVHKIEPQTDKCNGGNSALGEKSIEVNYHPSNYVVR